MNRFYYVAPVVAMLLFTGLFFAHQRTATARRAAVEKRLVDENALKMKAETDARTKAFAEAIQAQELRKAARAEKEARELAEKTTRQEAVDLRDKVFRDQEKLARQIEHLQHEIETEKLSATKIEDEILLLEAERSFLREFDQKARANVKTLADLMATIATTETARAAVKAPGENKS